MTDYTREFDVMSYTFEVFVWPHALMVFIRQDRFSHYCLVKFIDSEGTKPDLVHDARGNPSAYQYAAPYVVGKHVFVVIDVGPVLRGHSHVLYVNQNRVVFDRHLERPNIIIVTCYDGLLLFADGGCV